MSNTKEYVDLQFCVKVSTMKFIISTSIEPFTFVMTDDLRELRLSGACSIACVYTRVVPLWTQLIMETCETWTPDFF